MADLSDSVGAKVALSPKFADSATIGLQVADVRATMTGTGPGAETALHASVRTLVGSLGLMATNLMEVTDVIDTWRPQSSRL